MAHILVLPISQSPYLASLLNWLHTDKSKNRTVYNGYVEDDGDIYGAAIQLFIIATRYS